MSCATVPWLDVHIYRRDARRGCPVQFATCPVVFLAGGVWGEMNVGTFFQNGKDFFNARTLFLMFVTVKWMQAKFFFVPETCITYLSDSCKFLNCSVSPLPYSSCWLAKPIYRYIVVLLCTASSQIIHMMALMHKKIPMGGVVYMTCTKWFRDGCIQNLGYLKGV